MFIELLDNRDKDLLVGCVLNGIKELAALRDKSEGWGCGTMSIEDTLARLQRILKEISEEE